MEHIYIITNTQTGKVYVGRTKNTVARFAVHRSELNRGKHSNPGLQRDYTANPNIWTYYVIEDIAEDGKDIETQWINAFPDVYNQLNRRTEKPLEEYERTHSMKISHARRRPCTIDGVTIYPSVTALKKCLGNGKNGARHPDRRFV